jgi:septum site-determining protein MinD
VTVSTGALIGAAGGVGTTRLCLEVGAALAADGRDTVLIDAALDTQGLAAHVSGRIEPDLTAVITGEGSLSEALRSYPVETAGSLQLCPVHAPYTRIAAGKAPTAAERLGEVVTEATSMAEHVLVDVPPLASNTAVAGAGAADRRAIVTPATIRGRDALSRTQGSLADLGLTADLIVANRSVEGALADADQSVPDSEVTDVPEEPACLGTEPGFGPAIADLTESMFDLQLDVDLGVSFAATAREYLS